MNARQKKKQLKRQINQLKRDNELMREIIADSPKMQELYNLYTKPLNVTQATMEFREFKTRRFLPPDRPDDAVLITFFKRDMERDLFKTVKENIEYKLEKGYTGQTITASVIIGRK